MPPTINSPAMRACLVVQASDSIVASTYKLIKLDEIVKECALLNNAVPSSEAAIRCDMFKLPIEAVHAAIDILADIRKHNSKHTDKEIIVHIAITFGEVRLEREHMTDLPTCVGPSLSRARELVQTSLPNYILVDDIIYGNLKQHSIDFRLITRDDAPDTPFYSVKTNEDVSDETSRRINSLNMKIEKLER